MCIPYLCLDDCVNGDVKVESDGTPKFHWNGQWAPICGHYFWNNEHGASTFCRKLGYTGAKLEKTRASFSEDAIAIGECLANEELEFCSGMCNDKVVGKGCVDCTAGKPVSLTINCTGHDIGTMKSTCQGIPLIV